MIRIMLVDDEPFIRVAIKSIFNWEEHGFQIVSESSNGESAILKLKDDLPDVIITDIKMPIADGISLIKHTKSYYPQVKCVALSNYDDFDLTRAAFLEGAVDYILKSDLNEKTFTAFCMRMHQNFFANENGIYFEQTNELSKSNSEANQKSAALLQMIQHTSINEEQLSLLDCDLPYIICVIILDADQTTERVGLANEKLIKTTIAKIILEISDFHIVTCCDILNQFVLMIYNNEKTSNLFMEKLSTFLDSLYSNINVYLNTQVSIGVGGINIIPVNLPEAYNQALLQTQNIFYDTNPSIYYYKEQKTNINEINLLIENKLCSAPLFSGQNDLQKIEEFFTLLCNLIKNKHYPPQSVKQLIVNLLFLLQSESIRYRISVKTFPDNETLYENILHSHTMTELEYCLRLFLQQINDKVNNKQSSNSYSDIVEHAIEYLNKNFSNPNVSLNTTAQAISVNQSYLSRIFHKEMGVVFNSYVTTLRLQMAKRLLLNTKDSVDVVAENSGYNNSKYFINLFKKTEGITPSAYRNQILQSYCKKTQKLSE